MTKLWVYLALTMVELVLVGVALYNGSYPLGISAVVMLLATLYAALKMHGLILSLPSIVLLGAITLPMVSIISSNANPASVTEAHAAAVFQFNLLPTQCRPASPKVSELADFGIRACSFSAEIDKFQLEVMAQKFVKPETDNSIGIALKMFDRVKPLDACAEATKAAYQLCSDGGMYLQEKDKQILLSRAKL